MPSPKAPQSLKDELDRCVKCGLCLAECPTYRLAADENESPRGRISLIEGLLSGRLEASPSVIGHLDNCLGCRRCERICPSQVRYGPLLDQAREQLARGRPNRWQGVLQHPDWIHWGTRFARAIPGGVSRPFTGLARMHALARSLPDQGPAPRPGDYPAHGETRGRVGLFTGCTGAALQAGALQAALRLLQHSGFAVAIPAEATCCGALAAHAGDTATAASLATRNRNAFADDLSAVLSIASGCGVQLDGYQPPLCAPHQDICRFLLQQAGLRPDDFEPMPGRVWLHTPCTVENVYRGAAWADGLLRLIPGLQIEAVGETGQCCGAAGDHMLRQPDRAARLRQPLLDQVNAQTGILLTSNVGCALHLAEGLRRTGKTIEVIHPVQLLARQLKP